MLRLYRASPFFQGTDLVLRVLGGKIGVIGVYHTLYTHCRVRHEVTERSLDSGVKP